MESVMNYIASCFEMWAEYAATSKDGCAHISEGTCRAQAERIRKVMEGANPLIKRLETVGVDVEALYKISDELYCGSIVATGALEEDLERWSERIRNAIKGVNPSKSTGLPEGVEWPRFEDGEPVKIGDEFVNAKGNTVTVTRIALSEAHFTINKGQGRVCKTYGTRIKRPEPKILGADGKPIKVGETVYGEDGRAWAVQGYNHGKKHSVWANDGDARRDLCPEWLTHVKPVLDADGVPIMIGDTVWDGEGISHKVISFRDQDDDEQLVWCGKMRFGEKVYRIASQLTHEKPETLEAIKDDATMHSGAYCVKHRLVNNSEDADEATVIERHILHLLERQRKLLGGDSEWQMAHGVDTD